MPSDYLNSLKGNFNPRNKGEKKAKFGGANKPVLNQNPKKEAKMSFGSK